MRAAPGIAALGLSAWLVAGSTLAQNAPGITDTGTNRIKLQLRTIANNIVAGSPVDGTFAFPGDNRLFLANRAGTVTVITKNNPNPYAAGAFTYNPTPFLNLFGVQGVSVPLIAPDSGGGEQGLLGLAFHPEYNLSGTSGFRKFYTYTSESSSGGTPHFVHNTEPSVVNHHSVLREWTANPAGTGVQGTAQVPGQGRVVMRVVEPQSNHNGGALQFGPDNYLYISLGDGGGGNDNQGGVSNTDGHTNPGTAGGPAAHGNAQDRRNILGSIVRINPLHPSVAPDPNSNISGNGLYQVPKSNPFTLDSNPANPANFVDEIWAYGLRNPFRMSFDSVTGKLYTGDVGQSNQEEINEIIKGGNYGWVMREGIRENFSYATPDTLIGPLGAYPRADGVAVIGGYIYRGSLIPELQGMYVFGEYFGPPGTGAASRGRLLYMDPNQVVAPGQLRTIREFILPGDNALVPALGPVLGDAPPSRRLYGFGQDSDGELYALFVDHNTGVGTVVALVPEPSSWLLAGMGGLALLWRTWRRRRWQPAA